jgi:multiple sugar transport system permease protein/N-acetylglucosamine transport system permease protein
MTTIARTRRPRVPRYRRRTASGGVLSVVGRVFVWLFVASALGLVAWTLLTSFRDTRAIFENPLALPDPWRFDNYVTAWQKAGFASAVTNSLIVTVASSLLVVVVAAPAAYVLARSTRRIASPLTVFFVLGLGVPGQVLFVPIFLVMVRMQDILHIPLLNTLHGLVLVYVALGIPFTVFLLTGFFRSLPVELEEAAALDGASGLRTFVRIVLPVARSGITTALILQMLSYWNETLFALVLAPSHDHRTLPIALLQFMQQQQYSGADWGGLYAGIIILTLPTFVAFILAGRRLMEGLTVGVSK